MEEEKVTVSLGVYKQAKEENEINIGIAERGYDMDLWNLPHLPQGSLNHVI